MYALKVTGIRQCINNLIFNFDFQLYSLHALRKQRKTIFKKRTIISSEDITKNSLNNSRRKCYCQQIHGRQNNTV